MCTISNFSEWSLYWNHIFMMYYTSIHCECNHLKTFCSKRDASWQCRSISRILPTASLTTLSAQWNITSFLRAPPKRCSNSLFSIGILQLTLRKDSYYFSSIICYGHKLWLRRNLFFFEEKIQFFGHVHLSVEKVLCISVHCLHTSL